MTSAAGAARPLPPHAGDLVDATAMAHLVKEIQARRPPSPSAHTPRRRRRTSARSPSPPDPVCPEQPPSVPHAAQPDEVYNLAAQSHVAVSFVMPSCGAPSPPGLTPPSLLVYTSYPTPTHHNPHLPTRPPSYTSEVNASGTVNVLEAIRLAGLARRTRFYQASTSELYGGQQTEPFDEEVPFNPRSPYAAAKLMGFWRAAPRLLALLLLPPAGRLLRDTRRRFRTRRFERGRTRLLERASCAG